MLFSILKSCHTLIWFPLCHCRTLLGGNKKAKAVVMLECFSSIIGSRLLNETVYSISLYSHPFTATNAASHCYTAVRFHTTVTCLKPQWTLKHTLINDSTSSISSVCLVYEVTPSSHSRSLHLPVTRTCYYILIEYVCVFCHWPAVFGGIHLWMIFTL